VAFLALERARERVQMGDSLAEALAAVKRTTVFTTHTPVPAGNETFDRKLVRRYLEPWIRDVGCEPEEAIDLGRDNGNFNMTAFSIRLAASTNGVSRLHGEVSSAMWRHLFPDGASQPVGHVTNGVHTSTWVGPEMRTFYGQHVDPPGSSACWSRRRGRRSARPRRGALGGSPGPEGAPDPLRARARPGAIGAPRPRPRRAATGRGPARPHALTIGFARRFATYKRAFLIMTDLDRLRALVSDPAHPVQLVFAGKAHPADREGQEVVRRLFSSPTGSSAGSSSSSRTTTSRSAAPSCRAATCG